MSCIYIQSRYAYATGGLKVMYCFCAKFLNVFLLVCTAPVQYVQILEIISNSCWQGCGR